MFDGAFIKHEQVSPLSSTSGSSPCDLFRPSQPSLHSIELGSGSPDDAFMPPLHHSPIYPTYDEMRRFSEASLSVGGGRTTPLSHASSNTSLSAPSMEERLSSGSSMHDLKPVALNDPDGEVPRVKHRRRTTTEQLKAFEAQFEINPKPGVERRKELAAQLEMTPREVQVWFQNRRAKHKKMQRAMMPANEEVEVLPSDSSATLDYYGDDSPSHVQHGIGMHHANGHYAGHAPFRYNVEPTSSPSSALLPPPLPYSITGMPVYPLADSHNARRASAPMPIGGRSSPDYTEPWPQQQSTGPGILAPTYGYAAQARWAATPVGPPATSALQPLPAALSFNSFNFMSGDQSSTPVIGQAGFTSDPTPVPLQTAFPPPPPSSRPSPTQVPVLPRMESNESMPSSASTGFSDFHFGTAGRRDSLVSDASTATESDTMTPLSAHFSSTGFPTAALLGGHPDLYAPLGFDPDVRRASCPAEFIASFQHLQASVQAAQQGGAGGGESSWLEATQPQHLPAQVLPVGPRDPRLSLPKMPPLTLAPLGSMIGRRHSVATSYIPVTGPATTVLPYATPVYTTEAELQRFGRRGSTTSLSSLGPIAEYDGRGERYGGDGEEGRMDFGGGAVRKHSMARKARSQSNLRPLVRPLTQQHPATIPPLPTTNGAAAEEGYRAFPGTYATPMMTTASFGGYPHSGQHLHL